MASKFSNLPEGVVANIISFTTPRDACRFSRVSNLFHSAADSDYVWNRFLTPDLLDIIARTDVGVQNQLLRMLRDNPKKKFYMLLTNIPIIFDSGRKGLFLDKSSGKKCLKMGAREMSIVWGDTIRYWIWMTVLDSRFEEVARLIEVCWLEMSLKTEVSLLSPDTTYVAYLVFKLVAFNTRFEDVPVDASVGMTNGVKNTKTIFLASDNIMNYGRNVQYPKRRGDGWMEVALGEVFVDGGGDGGDMVEVWVAEVKDGRWKHSLIVEGIEFRPKA